MSNCNLHQPIRFGATNYVPESLITKPATTPDTSIQNIKTEWASRITRWNNPVIGVTYIDIVIDKPRAMDYIAFPDNNLAGPVEIAIIAYSGDDYRAADIVYSTNWTPVTKPKPLGQWQAGVDPYGGVATADKPTAFVQWFPKTVIAQTVRVHIRHTAETVAAADGMDFRMILIGKKLELNNNFSYGGSATFTTPPKLARSAGGRYMSTRPQQNVRSIRLSLDNMTDRDFNMLRALENQLGSRALIVSAYPSPDELHWLFSGYSGLMRFANSLEFTHVYEDHHKTEIILVEA